MISCITEMGDVTSEVEAVEQSYTEHIVIERILDGKEEPCNLKFSLLQHITDNFSMQNKIGRGGCADVYKVTLHHS